VEIVIRSTLPRLKEVSDVGTVYGLFKEDRPFRPDHYTCLFVGETNDLRTRLFEHYNNPSIPGVTHFFAEASVTEQHRKMREKELIAEFNPAGNKLDEADSEKATTREVTFVAS
jgi:hypothetical protein